MKTLIKKLLVTLVVLFGLPLIMTVCVYEPGQSIKHLFLLMCAVQWLIMIFMPWWSIPLIMILIATIDADKQK